MKANRFIHALSAMLAGLMLVGCALQSADSPLPRITFDSTSNGTTGAIPSSAVTTEGGRPVTTTESGNDASGSAIAPGTTEQPPIPDNIPTESATQAPATNQPTTTPGVETPSETTPQTTESNPVTDPPASSQVPTPATSSPTPTTSKTPTTGTEATTTTKKASSKIPTAAETPIPTPHTHSWGSWKVTKAAACTADGSQQRSCKGCDEVQTQTVPATGHNWGTWKITKEAACTTEGTRTRSCSVCKKTETNSIDALDHDWYITGMSSSGCEGDGWIEGICDRCGEVVTEITPPDHSPDSIVLDYTVPTCTEDGIVLCRCDWCGAEFTEIIPACGHSWGSWADSTSSSSGGTIKVTRSCLNCTEKESIQVALSEIVSLEKLENKKSLQKKSTDAQFRAAYNEAVKIVAPLVGLSPEEQLFGIVDMISEMLYNGRVEYSQSAPNYNDPYGYLISGAASCSGCTRTVGLCLNMLGISYEHVNEGLWEHQWCRVNVDGIYWICDAFSMTIYKDKEGNYQVSGLVQPEFAPYEHPYY